MRKKLPLRKNCILSWNSSQVGVGGIFKKYSFLSQNQIIMTSSLGFLHYWFHETNSIYNYDIKLLNLVTIFMNKLWTCNNSMVLKASWWPRPDFNLMITHLLWADDSYVAARSFTMLRQMVNSLTSWVSDKQLYWT